MEPGSIPLHTCGGTVRFSMEPRLLLHAYCKHPDCRAPVAPEQPWMDGHAGYYCTFCFTRVGFCASGLLAGLLDDAEHVLREGWKP